jgi:hypothetical protein
VIAARALAAWVASFAAAGAPVSALDAAGEPGSGAPRAFIDVSTPRASAWLGETVRVRLRFGFERQFLAEGLIQLFQRPLDVPVQVEASWLTGTSCAELVSPESTHGAVGAATAGFALGDGLARAVRAPDEMLDGQPFAVFELERDFVLLCPGEWTLQSPSLRFAYATSFRTDAFGDRTPQDRRDETLSGAAWTVLVEPLPEVGRPPGFSGAVGSFAVSATAEPRELAVGESAKLELTISGAGDLARCAVPRLERAEGLRAQGWVDELRPGARVITYDLVAASAGPTAIPAIEFSYFDPAPPGTYRVATTEPIPLKVNGGAMDPVVPAPPDEPTVPPSRTWKQVLVFLFAFAALALARVALVLRRRARAGEPGGVDEGIARSVAREVSSRPAGELGHALAEYLASRLECPVPAVIGPGLTARLEAAGIPPQGAHAVAELLEELVEARYGGAAASDAAERTRVAVELLEIQFRRASRRA